jgi:hypothetical protein
MVRIIHEAETGAQVVMSPQRIAEYIGRISQLASYASHAMSSARIGIKNTPVRAAVAVASNFVSNGVLDHFCKVLISGMPERPEDVTIITLRNRLITKVHSRGGSERILTYKMVLRFIKAYDQGVVLTMAKATSELSYRLGVFDEK